MVDLLRALDAVRAVPWIRVLYTYPIGINAPLLRAMVELPSVVEYLDLPLQHVSEGLLSKMQRPLGRLAPRPLVEYIRAQAPELHLRTTFIVGFPGERDAAIDELEEKPAKSIAQQTAVSLHCYGENHSL